jgi:hypothetical protein
MSEDGHTTDGRALRADDRPAHDGVDRDPTHRPGPVKHLVAKGKRIVVTTDTPEALAAAASLTFSEQKDAIERANSIALARVVAAIEAGTGVLSQNLADLRTCASITKAMLAEDRANPSAPDPSKMSDEDLRKAAK